MGVENGTNGTYTTNGTNGLRPTHQHTGLIGLICLIGLISLNAKSPLIGIENNTRQKWALKMGLMGLIRPMGQVGYAQHINTLVSLVLFAPYVLSH